jgi:hypothetical protein
MCIPETRPLVSFENNTDISLVDDNSEADDWTRDL